MSDSKRRHHQSFVYILHEWSLIENDSYYAKLLLTYFLTDSAILGYAFLHKISILIFQSTFSSFFGDFSNWLGRGKIQYIFLMVIILVLITKLLIMILAIG